MHDALSVESEPADIVLRGEGQSAEVLPAVGIVIPVYGHSEYLADALASAVSQSGIRKSIVVVVDGCPHIETYRRAFSWAASCPDVRVLFKANAGLSAARNSGLEYLLARHPELEFVYFLDADNTLGLGALSRAAAQLREAPEEVAWAYPDISTTGIFEENLCARTYSRLAHLKENICEAGSLVRAEVLRQTKVRFDEAMRGGYEDWDFWLTLVERGYRGMHSSDLALHYRRRPASMLATSHTIDDELRAYLQKKHKGLFAAKSVLELDRLEAPRYLSYAADTQQFQLHHHPLEPREVLSLADCAERLRRASDNSPAALPIGQGMCFTTGAAYAVLGAASLAGPVLHRIERILAAGAHLVVADMVDWDQSALSVHELAASEPVSVGTAHLYALPARTLLDVLRDKSNDWLRNIIFANNRSLIKYLRINIPAQGRQPLVAPVIDAEEMLSTISQLRRSGFGSRVQGPAPPPPWGAVEPGKTAAAVLETPAPYNNAAAGKKPVAAITVPISSFGGMERVAHQIGRVLRSEGFHTQLFVVWDEHAGNSRLLSLGFHEIIPLGLGGKGAFGGAAYLGTPTFAGRVDRWHSDPKLEEIYSCLIGADVVINCHSPEVHALAAKLRKQGVMTIGALQVFDLTPSMRAVGHPYLAVAYEHGYDRIIVPSHELQHKLIGLGVPSGKLLLMRNGSGVPEEMAASPGAPGTGARQPLKCLFVGRLDPQKGLDRLIRVMEILKTRQANVSWTVVGGKVVAAKEDHSIADTLAELGAIYRPPLRDEQLYVDELVQADVLVLPSYWEGVPLVLIDAMRFGVVPVATRVGGVGEVIEDGRTGFCVPSDARTERAIADVILRLAAMPREELKRMGVRAAAFAAKLTWPVTTAPLVAAIREHLDQAGIGRATRSARVPRAFKAGEDARAPNAVSNDSE